MRFTKLLLLSILVTSCHSVLEYNPERFFIDDQKNILSQFILAEDSSIIELPAGHFIFDKSLILEGKSNVIIKGQGEDKTVLSFKDQNQGAEGIRVANCQNITLSNFTIEDAVGDNIKVTDTKTINITNVTSGWTGVVDKNNGAYGFYPVICENVTIKKCTVFGSSDAGIYVGQSDTVLIENNVVYWNVAGIESENSKNVIIRNNRSYENTGGILVFDLPGLTQYGNNIEVYHNEVYENNVGNFAPTGNMVAIIPAGTGIMVLATKDVYIHDNVIRDNKTFPLGIISYKLLEELGGNEISGGGGSREELASQHQKDENYDPYVGNIKIYDNQYSNKYFLPDLENDFGKLFLYKFGFSPPQVSWDGIESPDFRLADGTVNPQRQVCVKESNDIKTVNLSVMTEFENLEINPELFNCD